MLKNLLIIGGTQMVGRDFVEFCTENNCGCELFLANRGITNPSLFPQIKHIKIDRNFNNGCEQLANNYYDIVIDFSCYNSQQLYNVLKYTNFKNYFLMSTMTVLDHSALSDESNILHKYAWDKKLLEEYIISNNLPITIVRTGALYGKNDYTNRFYEHNNLFFWKHNNKPVIKSKYIINVKIFTLYLYQYIFNNMSSTNNIIQIDLEGITKINTL